MATLSQQPANNPSITEVHSVPVNNLRPGSSVASLEAVTKRYGHQTALHQFSLGLYPGEVVALLGPNGAGKTTTVRLLLGLSRPDSGEVRVFDRDPRERSARIQVGTMLQVGAGGVPETLRVREHIDLFRSYYPNPLPEAEIISIAGLNGIEDRRVGKLSGGQKQRVLFALALCGDPALLFLDEPTVGMDVEARRALWEQIRSLAARGKTILLTTHYLEEADALASRIVVLADGKLVAQGTSEEIKATQGIRKIRCRTSLELDFLRALPSVTAVVREGSSTVIATLEPDNVVRQLVLHDAHLSGLEVGNAGLEDAFLALTVKHPDRESND
jgi:ABC-2 type transport system ATP-binding protein